MRKKPVSPKSVSMLQLGMLLIVAGPLASVATGLVMAPAADTAAARGQAIGRALVAVVAVVSGIALIVSHFARGKRS
jgi:hypothetical protein